MKIIKIKNLLRIVEEVSSEYSEMALKPKGTQSKRIDPKTGEPKIDKAKPFWKEGNDTEIPDYWVINPNQVKGQDRLIIPLDCTELQDFINENSEWLDNIAKTHGLDPEMLPKCKKTKYHPRNIKVGTSYKWSGERLPAKTKIKRILHDKIEEFLASPDVTSRLDKASVPEIMVRNEKHLNKYGRMDNQKIEYGTHTFNSYETSAQFLKFVTARIAGKQLDDDVKSYHLARQFNQIYRKWFETKKNDKQYFGKTEAYMLDRFGFDEDNLDVTVRTDLKITGQNDIMANKYTWTATLETKFGRKLTDDRSLGRLDLDKSIVIGPKEFEYSMPKNDQGEEMTFTDEYTVLDNFEIQNGLIEVLGELKEKIMTEFKPINALKLANIKNFDITRTENP